MKKVIYFILVSLLAFTSCKKDGSNPVNADMVPSTPTLATPEDTSSNIAVPVVLTWNKSGGATSYTLQVSASSSFSSFVFNKSDITTTSQQITELNYFSVYYWRVNASNSTGASDWSKVLSFTTTGEAALVPQLSLPTNGAVEQKLSPVLVWNKVSNANSYTLQISTNSSFTNFVFNADTLTATSKQITELSGLTQYYWRVSATNNFGTKGWSETWSFTTGVAPVPPVLISPSDGAIDVALSTTLTWNASSVATTYTLQVSTSNSFSSFVYNQSGTATNKQITGLTNSTKYYWRVSTTNNYGTSTPSTVWSFTTGAPTAPPTLLTPTDGTINISLSPTLTWNASNGASYYSLQVATDNSFTNMIYNNNVGNITTKQISGLTSSTKYYWNVRVTTDFGTSNPSDIWFFTTDTAAVLVTYGPIQIWETSGTTAAQPSGIDLSSGNAYGISSANKADVDIYYTSTGFVVTSAHNASGLTRRTYFKVGGSNTLADGIASLAKDASWEDRMGDRPAEYVFLYDADLHYSKIIIDSYGGGTIGNPAWVKVKWIYNKTASDVRFK